MPKEPMAPKKYKTLSQVLGFCKHSEKHSFRIDPRSKTSDPEE